MPDWDATRYHRVPDPQLAWGRRALDRLAPRPGERILDLGCGTGRLTAEIAAGPGTLVVGLDRSAAMLSQARGQTPAAGTDRAAVAPLSFTLDYWRLNITARKGCA